MSTSLPSRKPTLRSALAGVALTFAASSCAEYEFAEQDLSLQYLAKTDQVLLEVDTRGIHATQLKWGEGESFIIARARDRVRRMAEGERYLHLLSFPLIFDLDAETPPTPPDVDDAIILEAMVALRGLFLGNMHVDGSRAYLDAEGEVAVLQEVRIEHATACIHAINALITLGVRDAIMESANKREDDELDLFESKASRDNLSAFMDSGGSWLSLSEKQLEIRVPMMPTDLAILLKGLASDDQTGSSAALGTALFNGLDELVVERNVALFTFPVEGDGAVHWRYRADRHPDAQKLVAAFESGELNKR